jgi:hypothetical protein
LHAVLSKNLIYWGAGIATAAAAVMSGMLIAGPAITWPGVQTPTTVVSPSANPTVATLAAAPADASGGVLGLSPSKLAVQPPAFDIVRVEPTGDAVIAGHAEPEAVVELRDDGRVVAQASADASGEFTMLPPPFSTGSHHLELAVRTGGAVAVSSDSVAIDVPALAGKASSPVAPTGSGVDAPTASKAAAAIPSGGQRPTLRTPPPILDAPSVSPSDRGVAASVPSSVTPPNRTRVLVRSIAATKTLRSTEISAAIRSPEATPEPTLEQEPQTARPGGGHR